MRKYCSLLFYSLDNGRITNAYTRCSRIANPTERIREIRVIRGLAERKMKDEKEALDYFRTSQFVMQERVHIACTLII